MSDKRVILYVELKPGEAACLKRLADKTGWSQAMAVLYPHIDQEIRGDQTREILRVSMKHWRQCTCPRFPGSPAGTRDLSWIARKRNP